MNPITQARLALLERLGTISPANGYRTTAGANARTGWLNEVIQAKGVGYPLIVVQPAKGAEPVAGPGAIKHVAGFHVVGAVNVGTDYEAALEDLQLDLQRCLLPAQGRFPKWLPIGCTAIRQGAAEPYPPGDGLPCATVLIPIYITLVIQE